MGAFAYFVPDHTDESGLLGLVVDAAQGVEHRHAGAHEWGRGYWVHSFRHLKEKREETKTNIDAKCGT